MGTPELNDPDASSDKQVDEQDLARRAAAGDRAALTRRALYEGDGGCHREAREHDPRHSDARPCRVARPPRRPFPMSTPNERELVEFGERLSRYRKIAPRPEFRAELRSSLLAARVSLESPRASRLGWSRLLALRPALAVILVLLLLATAGCVAAASSLPGDP